MDSDSKYVEGDYILAQPTAAQIKELKRIIGDGCKLIPLAESECSDWQQIETAPENGQPIILAKIEDGFIYDVLHGHFELVEEDEDDGAWDIRDGEPWCSYVGRTAGIYFCFWLPEKEWESRWKFGPNTGYTHWMHLPSAPKNNTQ